MFKRIIIIFFLVYTVILNGQENTDSLFDVAIELSKEKEYDVAIEIAEGILHSTERGDIMVFLANLYAWKGEYEKAEEKIKKAYNEDKSSDELYTAWMNILLWNEKYDALLKVIATAEAHAYKDTFNLVFKKTIALRESGKYEQAIEVLEAEEVLLDTLPVRQLYTDLLLQTKNRIISLYYTIDYFDNYTLQPQHLVYIDYLIPIKEKMRLLFRLNYAHRYNEDDLLAETDCYYTLGKGYIYGNYGYALFRNLFATHRGGAEYYAPPVGTFDISIGGRYFYKKDASTAIATGHVGKFFTRSYLELRPYGIFAEEKLGFASVLSFKYSGKKQFNYWRTELHYGNSPDERDIIPQLSDIYRLESYKIKIEKNITVNRIDEFKIAAAYTYEEYVSSEYRSRYTIELLFKHRF